MQIKTLAPKNGLVIQYKYLLVSLNWAEVTASGGKLMSFDENFDKKKLEIEKLRHSEN